MIDSLDKIIELARMVKWFRTNRTRLCIGRQEDADALFDSIINTLHVDALGEALKVWLAEGEAIDTGGSSMSERRYESGTCVKA